ncbi:alcohol dehydrogenase catalytic domain-containing protein [Magnetospira sp. QH-2]|uniref:alcohol dehydrogenase catalytic domain-containing protein n=1 Tax=Magnetospira sp. (strain QH-2) TaxID=1288970 RepID=UPI0003E8154B|nr:alcohol dehydrogenase catalytic domain-containing protein [Magnetospira sp. QH-2]CCQ75502.1 Putative GT2 [Magnetospira sp. QH-2]
MPETSVIVRTFNEEKHLPALFAALDRQAYRDFEVILVDSGSYDRTRDIATEWGVHKLIRISSHDFTFGYSLNKGIEAGSGRFIAMCSAHTVPVDGDWLENLVRPLRDNDDVAMVYGRQVGVASSKFAEAEDFERVFGPTPREDRKGSFAVNNANSAMPRRLWEITPFDDALPGLEDIALAQYWVERSWRVLYEPSAVLSHIHEETWPQVQRRYYREAVAARRSSVIGRRHIPAILAKESGRTIADCLQALAPKDNPAAQRLPLAARWPEILRFRIRKTLGTIRGLIEPHPMETQEEREQALFNRMNRVVQVKGPGKVALEVVDIPDLKPGDVLIRVAHVAVCATDLEIRDGTLGFYHNGMADFPIVPGHEFSGRVAAVGVAVEDFAEGEPVVAECIQSCGTCDECRAGNFIGCADRSELGVMRRDGAYGDYVVVPSRFLHKVPDGMDLRRAALTEPLAVVHKGLRRLSTVLDDGPKNCAVIGSGPLGHLCSKALAGRGHKVTAFDRNPKRRALFDGTGIATAEDLSSLRDYQVIVEITGDPEVLDRALHDSPANCSLLLLGLPYGKRAFSFEAVAAYDKTVTGSVGSTAEDFEAAIALLPDLDLDEYFKCPMALADFEAAWKTSQTGEVLKVILDVASEDRS